MIYEYRVYHAPSPSEIPLLTEVLQTALGHLRKHGAEVVGCWTTATTVSENSSRVIYMLGFRDYTHLSEVWHALRSDSDWHADLNRLTHDGALQYVTHFSNYTMVPVEVPSAE